MLLMLPGHLIGATGAGDVKLLAAFGTLLGPGRTVAAFLYMAIAGGALALAVAIARRRTRTTIARAIAVVHSPDAVAAIERPTENNRFAYAPAIAIGAFAAALGL
jgi:prepilin peptidase CpaA